MGFLRGMRSLPRWAGSGSGSGRGPSGRAPSCPAGAGSKRCRGVTGVGELPCSPPRRGGFRSRCETRGALGVKRLDALTEVVGLPQAAVAVSLELDGDGQARVLGVVEELLGGALGDGRGEKARSSSTRASVAFSRSASGTHSVAMPQSRACRPGMRFERITMSFVRVIPTIFWSRAEPPEPGIWPSFCSGSA